jgi:hypothetical protein
MSNNRRSAERAQADLLCKWEGVVGSDLGTVSDLSVEGCFVVCSGSVLEHEQIKLEFNFPDFTSLPFYGEVVYQIDEIGFALRFIDPTPAQTEFLGKLMAASAQAKPSATP